MIVSGIFVVVIRLFFGMCELKLFFCFKYKRYFFKFILKVLMKLGFELKFSFIWIGYKEVLWR